MHTTPLMPTRRRWIAPLLVAATVALPAPLLAKDEPPQQEGVNVGKMSQLRKLVSAEDLEKMAEQQFAQLKREAASKQALAPDSNPQVQRLRRIAQRIIPLSEKWNPRAREWRWEVALIGSDQVNAFCMPGGKIAFYTGILDKLKLTDDEVAMVMGHEVAHALREHSRERAGKNAAFQVGAGLATQLFGLGDLGRTVVGGGSKLWMLSFSRDDETEADLVGLELAARAGFDPRAGVSLWEKMSAASKGAPPQWLSTHPSGKARIDEINRHLNEVLPLYARAIGKSVDTLPPYRNAQTGAPRTEPVPMQQGQMNEGRGG